MRIKRHKKFQRYVAFYQQQLGFKPPFQIVIDGTFANAVLAAKVNMKEQFPKYFDGPCKLLTTPCVLIETEQLGPTLYGAVQVLKGVPLYKCQHGAKPIQAASCLKSIVCKDLPKKGSKARENNTGMETDTHFILATQDANLRSNLRQLIGIPLLYLHGNAPTLEKPSDNTVAWTEQRDKKKLDVSNYQKEILQHIKDEVLPGSSGSVRKGTKKRKRAGPNPLSCKKSKKKNSAIRNQNRTEAASNNSLQEQPKKKRKRIKVRVPKHVRELVATK